MCIATQTKIETIKSADCLDLPIEIFITDKTQEYHEVYPEYYYYEIAIANQTDKLITVHLDSLPLGIVPTLQYQQNHYSWCGPYNWTLTGAALTSGILGFMYLPNLVRYRMDFTDTSIESTGKNIKAFCCLSIPIVFLLATEMLILAQLEGNEKFKETDKSKKLNQNKTSVPASSTYITGGIHEVKYSKYHSEKRINQTNQIIHGTTSAIVALKKPIEQLTYTIQSTNANNINQYEITFNL